MKTTQENVLKALAIVCKERNVILVDKTALPLPEFYLSVEGIANHSCDVCASWEDCENYYCLAESVRFFLKNFLVENTTLEIYRIEIRSLRDSNELFLIGFQSQALTKITKTDV